MENYLTDLVQDTEYYVTGERTGSKRKCFDLLVRTLKIFLTVIFTKQHNHNYPADIHELYPCPFCGKQPIADEYDGVLRISCPNVNCIIVTTAGPKKLAIKEWNRRVIPQLADARKQGEPSVTIRKVG